MSIASRFSIALILGLVSVCSHVAVADEYTIKLRAWPLLSNDGDRIPYPGFVIGNSRSEHSIETAREVFESTTYKGFRAIPLEARGVFEWALIANDVPYMDVYKELATPEGVLKAIDTIKDANSNTYWYISEKNTIPTGVFAHMVPIITFRPDHNEFPMSSEWSEIGIDLAEPTFWDEREAFWGANEEIYNSILAFQLEEGTPNTILMCPPGKRCCPPGRKGCRKPPPCPKQFGHLAICPPPSIRAP